MSETQVLCWGCCVSYRQLLQISLKRLSISSKCTGNHITANYITHNGQLAVMNFGGCN